MQNIKQGENVFLSYTGVLSSTGAVMTVLDANMQPRPLKSYERLILDFLNGNGAATDGSVRRIIVFADANGDGAVQPNETITVIDGEAFGNATSLIDPGTTEGVSLPVGLAPSLTLVGAAFGGSTTVTGTGRVVEGKTQGVRPNWQCLQTPNGNF
jgi:hypothetical protein